MTGLEATKVVLVPVDTEELERQGYRINPREVSSEKRQLQGRRLIEGDVVPIRYRTGDSTIQVGYSVSHLNPSHASVGEKTVVTIETGNNGRNRNSDSGLAGLSSPRGEDSTFEVRKKVREVTWGTIAFYEDEIERWEKEGRKSEELRSLVDTLRSSAADFW